MQIKYGKLSVIKVAIGGAQDFIVVDRGQLILVVEVKECHSSKYYPSLKEQDQLKRIVEFCKHNCCLCEVWIHYPKHKIWDKKDISEYYG